MSPSATPPESDLAAQRRELLARLEAWLEGPMIALGFAWLLLLGVELLAPETWRRHPALDVLSLIIWGIFLVNFVVELIVAPAKRAYLRRNWLTAVSLAVPALRIFRVVRVLNAARLARAARGARLVRVVGSLNRGMAALGGSMRRRGFGYVVALTALITLGGAAGMYTFERDVPGGLDTYSEAVWWTAMIMTTMGSAYWPETAEGRVLCVVLALYAFAVFGYVTAALATHFVGRDAAAGAGGGAGAASAVDPAGLPRLQEEIRALRALVEQIAARQVGPSGDRSG